jgi:3-hydroxymyristoyl/3-hydroxydecanoyl-(acyl carrier protein) dehydratase
LIEELRAATPESEVLITDSQFYETFYSKDLVIPSGDGHIVRGGARPDDARRTGGALIERTEVLEPLQRASVIVRFDPANDPFLREHRLRDKPTLPLVVALEAFAETAALLAGGAQAVLAMRDIRIADAVRYFNEQPAEVRVHATMTDEGISCRLTSDFRNRRGDLVQPDRLHFSAVVEMGERPAKIDEAAPPTSAEWFDVAYPTRDALMYHGLPLRLLKQQAIGDNCAWGQLEIAAVNELAGDRDANGWLTPSAAIDACLYACGVYTWLCGDHGVGIPDSLGELRFGRAARPAERALVHLVCRELQEKFGVFDFTLFGDDSAVIFQAKKYRCHVLRAGGAPAERAPQSSESSNPSLLGRQTS